MAAEKIVPSEVECQVEIGLWVNLDLRKKLPERTNRALSLNCQENQSYMPRCGTEGAIGS